MSDLWDPGVGGRHPLAWPVRPLAERFAGLGEWPTIADLNARLGDAVGEGIAFVPAAPRGRRRAPIASADDLYDGRIVRDGCVPSRTGSWHDFFNALVWAAWPSSKRALHARQHAAIARRFGGPTRPLPPARTLELDRLAMLDEGGVVVLAGPDVAGAIERAIRRGEAAALDQAIAAGAAELLLFGHALYDRLRGDDGRMLAHAEVVAGDRSGAPSARLERADHALARALGEGRAPTLGDTVAVDLDTLGAATRAGDCRA